MVGTYFLLFSIERAAGFAETNGSSVNLGSGNREYECLKLSVLSSETHRRPCIFTLDRAAIFRAKPSVPLLFSRKVDYILNLILLKSYSCKYVFDECKMGT